MWQGDLDKLVLLSLPLPQKSEQAVALRRLIDIGSHQCGTEQHKPDNPPKTAKTPKSEPDEPATPAYTPATQFEPL